MLSCSRINDLASNNAAPLAIGIAIGVLGYHFVQWLGGYTPPKSSLTSFHIIHLKDREKPNVVEVTLEEFKGIATTEKLNGLRKSVDWGERTVEIWDDVLIRSAHIVCAIKNEELVAYGCLIGNGRMGMVTDIHVRPDHQKQQIGSHIMNDFVAYLKSRPYTFVGLFGWEENQSVLKFYKKFGFKQNLYGMESSSDALTLRDL